MSQWFAIKHGISFPVTTTAGVRPKCCAPLCWIKSDIYTQTKSYCILDVSAQVALLNLRFSNLHTRDTFNKLGIILQEGARQPEHSQKGYTVCGDLYVYQTLGHELLLGLDLLEKGKERMGGGLYSGRSWQSGEGMRRKSGSIRKVSLRKVTLRVIVTI